MAKITTQRVIPIVDATVSKDELVKQLRTHISGEVVFAVVGYAGSGTSFVATKLLNHFKTHGMAPQLLKARSVLDQFAGVRKVQIPSGADKMAQVSQYQSLGDRLRSESGEHGAVAAYLIRDIHQGRAANSDKRTIFILDSLKHPGEVDLLRHVYGDGFCLIGVGCRPDIRKKRLQLKFGLDNETKELNDFVNRDAEDSEHENGQQVNKTFHRADYFVDNTPTQENAKVFRLPDELKKLTEILFDGAIHRPNNDERGMFHAYAASLRSSCLSRQVGAAILDERSNLLAVGTNEVPKHGGGTYEENSDPDDRCFVNRKHCSNTLEQNRILQDVFNNLSDDKLLSSGTTLEKVTESIKSTRIRSLLEFSRSVHAEMDAILSLVRSGTKLPSGSTLYSTTYPCHNCARHIVSCGVSRVVYLEPYSKSMAIDLHDDSIADNKPEDESKGKVAFVPYQGVSPRLFRAVFSKTTDLKDKEGRLLDEVTIAQNSAPRAGIWKKTYKEFEVEIVKFIEEKIEKKGATNGA